MNFKKNKLQIPLIMFVMVICSGLFSCEKAYVSIGGNFIDNSTTNLILVDSSSIEFSTLYVDSFITSATGISFAGNYRDPQFGTVAATSFVQLGIPAVAPDIQNGAVFDSAEIILKPNKTFYGDSLALFSLAVHQLTTELKFPDNVSNFYNINNWPYSPTVLASTQQMVRPNTTDSVSLKLPTAFGQDLFDKLKNNATEMTSDDQFTNYFKGLAITGSVSNKMIVGFSDSVIMRLHYRKPGVFTENASIDFGVSNTSVEFNNINVDRSGTPIALLSAGNRQLFSSQTQQASYSQYISGAIIKMRFPYLHNLEELSGFAKIVRAELILKPVANSYVSLPLPDAIRLSTTDQYNELGDDITYYDGTGSPAVQYGSLITDKIYGVNTKYTFDVTTYIQSQIAITAINKNGLLLLPPVPATLFNRVVIGDGTNAMKSTLNIYYASVK